jgi:hypothetical protein
MILGMSLSVFLHTLISLVGIATGMAVLRELFRSGHAPRLTAWFLATTILTSVSGFFLPADKIMPSHVVGALSLAVLAVCCYARYQKRMSGAWRTAYVLSAVIALYFNVFVLVTQLFLKVPSLHGLAPQLNEPPFAIAQAAVLVAFVVAGIVAVLRFHPETARDEETAHLPS